MNNRLNEFGGVHRVRLTIDDEPIIDPELARVVLDRIGHPVWPGTMPRGIGGQPGNWAAWFQSAPPQTAEYEFTLGSVQHTVNITTL